MEFGRRFPPSNPQGLVFLKTTFLGLPIVSNAATHSSTMAAPDPITVASIKQLAKERLPKPVWDYYVTGSDDERTARRNESIYDT